MKYPNGPKISFLTVLIGQLMPKRYPFDPLAFGVNLARDFGDLLYYRIGPLQVYQLNHPDLARQILVEQPEKFYKPRLLKRVFRTFIGDGLLTSDGAHWRQQRKLIQPAFHHRYLAIFAEIMVTHALQMADSFAAGEVRDIGEEMTKLTLGIVVKTLFGSDLPREAGALSHSMLAVIEGVANRLNSALRLPSWVPTRDNRRERRVLRELNELLRSLIQARRASKEERSDLLSMLLAAADEESGARMSDQQLRDEMMTLFLAGHETTAMALTWTWYLLARHPEVEAKLAEELQRVLQGRPPALTDLPNLPYTEMIVREVLRLRPPAPGFAREPLEDVTIGGYTIRKGTLVTVNTYAMQIDPRFFPDPERFDPDRFAPGWEERIPRYAYLPFGGGPRVCIGNVFALMEARLILASVAQRYRLSLAEPGEIKPKQLVTLRPATPVRMKIDARAVNAPAAASV